MSHRRWKIRYSNAWPHWCEGWIWIFIFIFFYFIFYFIDLGGIQTSLSRFKCWIFQWQFFQPIFSYILTIIKDNINFYAKKEIDVAPTNHRWFQHESNEFFFFKSNVFWDLGQLCFGPSWIQKLNFGPYKFTI